MKSLIVSPFSFPNLIANIALRIMFRFSFTEPNIFFFTFDVGVLMSDTILVYIICLMRIHACSFKIAIRFIIGYS